MELENLRAKKEAEQRLRERQLELEQEREEIELRRQQEELRLQQQLLQQQQREQELQQEEQDLRLKLQQQEDELRLRKHERELENERKKAEADEEQRHMEIELTKGNSRASWSQVGDVESAGSGRNLERTTGWANSVAQHFGPSRPLSPNVLIDPPKNVSQDRGDKRFSVYPKTVPLFQPGVGLFSTQLQDSSILNKLEIPKSIRVAEPQTFCPRRRSSNKDRQRSKTCREARVPRTTTATDRWKTKTKQQ